MGVIIDIPTKIKALSDHKDLVYSIMGRFPVYSGQFGPAQRGHPGLVIRAP
jgi:hypothetical protein